jgi:hypothetical protein
MKLFHLSKFVFLCGSGKRGFLAETVGFGGEAGADAACPRCQMVEGGDASNLD